MKTPQLRHNMLQLFYYMAVCALGGFTAVFLQYHGLSNSMIGIVSGIGSLGITFVSPLVNQLIEKISWLTVKRALYISFTSLIVAFLIITAGNVPTLVLSTLFAASNILLVSVLPLTTLLPMEYIRTGHELNYGFARGCGSVSYAVAAVIIGRVCQMTNPDVLFVFFLISAVGLMWSITGIEDVQSANAEEKTESAGVLKLFVKYPLFGKLMVGYLLMFGATICLGTYLINIVRALGGNTTLYGIAVFCSAASEMPAMALAPKLIRKYDKLRLLQAASIGYILRNTLVCIAPNMPVLFLGCLMQGASYALFCGVLTYYITDMIGKEDQLDAHSLTIIVTSGIGSTIGNVASGFLQDIFGLSTIFVFSVSMTVLGAAIVVLSIGKSKQSYNTAI